MAPGVHARLRGEINQPAAVVQVLNWIRATWQLAQRAWVKTGIVFAKSESGSDGSAACGGPGVGDARPAARMSGSSKTPVCIPVPTLNSFMSPPPLKANFRG